MAFGAASRLFLSCLLGLGVVACAASPAVPPVTSEALASGGEALDLSSLAEENDALHDRVDDLESRLARVEAQNEELRVALGRATEGRSVRIGGTPTEHDEPELTVEPDRSVERDRSARSGRVFEPEPEVDPEVDGAGSRPLLTLHGPPVISLPSGETRPALASASPLAGPPAPSTALPPPAGSLGRLLVTGSPSDVPAIPVAPVTVLSGAPTETDSVALEYQAALRRLSERDLTGALEALGRFAVAHPEHPYADNALYFRGEIHYAGHQWRAAIDELEQLVARYPHGGRVADALLRIGMCWERLGDSARAERYFVRVRTEHPESSAARMAEREDT